MIIPKNDYSILRINNTGHVWYVWLNHDQDINHINFIRIGLNFIPEVINTYCASDTSPDQYLKVRVLTKIKKRLQSIGVLHKQDVIKKTDNKL